jgi:hypothetical protein
VIRPFTFTVAAMAENDSGRAGKKVSKHRLWQ